MEDDDDDGCTGQEGKQGEEHHLVGVYEAVQGEVPLHGNNWSGSLHYSTGIRHMNQSDRDQETLARGSTAYGNGSGNCSLRVHGADGEL